MASPDSTDMTVADVVSLEDAKENPLRPGSARSPKYFAMLEKRRRLPVMQGESFERFLDLYHNNQVGAHDISTTMRDYLQSIADI